MSGISRHRFAQGVGTIAATLTVAASDSSEANKSNADYICSGSNDQVTINSAIAKLTAGGKVLLLEGTYSIAGAINLLDSVTLAGQGWSTVLQVAAAAARWNYGIIQNVGASDQSAGKDKLIIRDLRIDGNVSAAPATHIGIYFYSCTDCLVDGVYIHDMSGGGIEFAGDGGQHNVVTNCHLENIAVSAGVGIGLTSVDKSIVSNNKIITCGGDAILLSWVAPNTCQYNTISNNLLEGFDTGDVGDAGIWLSSEAHFCVIEGNVIIGSGSDQTSSYGIYVEAGCTHNIIRGNTIRDVAYGMDLAGSVVGGNLVMGNQVYKTGYDGITISSKNNAIIGNYVEAAGQAADDTYSCILISGPNADQNNVQNNTCRQGTETNQPKYGINMDAAPVDKTFVTNNDLLDSGQTGALNDAGTGTNTVAGNRTA